jgi:hypothetical protein
MGRVVEMQALDMDIGNALGVGVLCDRISLNIDRISMSYTKSFLLQ